MPVPAEQDSVWPGHIEAIPTLNLLTQTVDISPRRSTLNSQSIFLLINSKILSYVWYSVMRRFKRES